MAKEEGGMHGISAHQAVRCSQQNAFSPATTTVDNGLTLILAIRSVPFKRADRKGSGTMIRRHSRKFRPASPLVSVLVCNLQ